MLQHLDGGNRASSFKLFVTLCLSTRTVPQDPSLFTQVKAAAIVKEKALAAKARRDAEVPPAAAAAVSAWGQSNRVEAMKERLLALEREKIMRMEPERLELMNLLADHGYNLDEDTVSALLRWKRD